MYSVVMFLCHMQAPAVVCSCVFVLLIQAPVNVMYISVACACVFAMTYEKMFCMSICARACTGVCLGLAVSIGHAVSY